MTTQQINKIKAAAALLAVVQGQIELLENFAHYSLHDNDALYNYIASYHNQITGTEIDYDNSVNPKSDMYIIRDNLQKIVSEEKTICCPECGSNKVRCVDHESLMTYRSAEEVVSNEHKYPAFDNEVYMMFVCDEEGCTGKQFSKTLDIVPRSATKQIATPQPVRSFFVCYQYVTPYGGLTKANGDELMQVETGIFPTLDAAIEFVHDLFDGYDTFEEEYIPEINEHFATSNEPYTVDDYSAGQWVYFKVYDGTTAQTIEISND